MTTATQCTRILIVDDDVNFRSAQKRNLRRIQSPAGTPLEILEASSGQDALECVKANRIDCILLDHNMPGGNGVYWLQKLLNENDDLAIIMLTGQGSEKLAVESMKNGAMDYLIKGSINPEELERSILNVVEKRNLRRTIHEQQGRLIEADRQRVMIESLGTACHHIGQPATVINAYLQMMETRETDAEMKDMISSCLEASESITEILKKLQQVTFYRTTPYLSGDAGNDALADVILAID